MSHKQSKRARKGIPHLNPNFIREKRRLQAEALTTAIAASAKAAAERREHEEAANPTMKRGRNTRTAGLALLAGATLATIR